MQFFFNWVKEKDAFSTPDVLAFHLVHREGDFPTLSVTLKEEGQAIPGTSGQLFLGERLLFEGFLEGSPKVLGEGTVGYLLSPKTLDSFQQALGELKKAPGWDPLFVTPGFEDQPREILDGYSVLPHWDRVGGTFCWSDILKGRNVLDVGGDFFKESLVATSIKNPIDQLDVEIKAEWIQSYASTQDIGPKIAEHFPQGRIETDIESWWQAPLKIKGSGYEVVESVLVEHEESLYEPTLNVAWSYRQKREETCCFQLMRPGNRDGVLRRYNLKMQLNDITLDGSLPYWESGRSYSPGDLVLYGGKVYEAMKPTSLTRFLRDAWLEKEGFQDGRYYPRAAFFATPPGRAAIAHGLQVGVAYLKSSSRAYEVTVELPLEQILDLSCDYTAKIGDYSGKVVLYEMISNGQGAFGRVKMYVSDLEHFQGKMGYEFIGSPYPKTGILDPQELDIVESVSVDVAAGISIDVVFADLTTTDTLKHRVDLRINELS